MARESSNKVEFIGNRPGKRSESEHLLIPKELEGVALYLNEKIAKARGRVQKPVFDPKENHPNPIVQVMTVEAHAHNEESLADLENLLYFLGDKNYVPVLEYFEELLAECELSIVLRKEDIEGFFKDSGSVTAEELEKEHSTLLAICGRLHALIGN